MSWGKGFWAVVRREIDIIVSRPMYLVLLVVIPLLTYVFFSTLMPGGLPQDLAIGVVDEDNSMVSRNMVRQVDATQTNNVIRHYTQYYDARKDMQKGVIYGFLVIPEHFESDVTVGRKPTLSFYYNAAYYIAGSLTLRNISTMLATLTGAVNLKNREARGQNQRDAMAQIQPIAADVHPIGNPTMNYSVYLINVLIPGVLELLILITTAYALGSELKRDTARGWLRMTDYHFTRAILGKMFPYTLMWIVMGCLYLILLFGWLRFPINCSIGWMVLDMTMLVMASECMAIFFVGLLPVLRDAMSACSLYGVLAFSFSGFTFPVEGMLPWVQGLANCFPLRFYFRIYQKMALNGLGVSSEWISFVGFACFLVLPFFVSWRIKQAALLKNFPKD